MSPKQSSRQVTPETTSSGAFTVNGSTATQTTDIASSPEGTPEVITNSAYGMVYGSGNCAGHLIARGPETTSSENSSAEGSIETQVSDAKPNPEATRSGGFTVNGGTNTVGMF